MRFDSSYSQFDILHYKNMVWPEGQKGKINDDEYRCSTVRYNKAKAVKR